MKSRVSCLGLLLGLLSLGCTAELESGVYGCSEGACPSGWTCGPDDLCYAPDAEVPLDLYEGCDVDADCVSGSCVRAFDPTATLGQCSTLPTCTSSSECPAVDGRAGACAPEVGCLGACAGAADCETNQDCLMVPRTISETACIELVDPDYSGKADCMTPTDCPTGAICVKASLMDMVGVCQWACAPGLDCAQGANCVRHDDMVSGVGMNPNFACMAPCDGTAGSCGMPPTSLVCYAYPPAGPQHCVPDAWTSLIP